MQSVRKIVSLITALCFLASSTTFAIDLRKVDTSSGGMHLAASLASGDIVSDRRLTLAEMMLQAYLRRIDEYLGTFNHFDILDGDDVVARDASDIFDNSLATQASVRAAFGKVSTHLRTSTEDPIQETIVISPDAKPIYVTLYENNIRLLGGNMMFGDIYMIPASVRVEGSRSVECRLLFSAKKDDNGNHPIASYTKKEYDRIKPEIEKNAKYNRFPEPTGKGLTPDLKEEIEGKFNIAKDPSKFSRTASKTLKTHYFKAAHDFLKTIHLGKKYSEKIILAAKHIVKMYEMGMSGSLTVDDKDDANVDLLIYLGPLLHGAKSKENLKKLLDILKRLGFVNYSDPKSTAYEICLMLMKAISGDAETHLSGIKLKTHKPAFETLWAQYNHLVEEVFTQYPPNYKKAITIAKAVLHAYYAEEVKNGNLNGEEVSELTSGLVLLLSKAIIGNVRKARRMLRRIHIELSTAGDSVIDDLYRIIDRKIEKKNFRSGFLHTEEYQESQKAKVSWLNRKEAAVDFISKEFSEKELEFLIKIITNPILRSRLKATYGEEKTTVGTIERLRATLHNLGMKSAAKHYPKRLPRKDKIGGLSTLREALHLKKTTDVSSSPRVIRGPSDTANTTNQYIDLIDSLVGTQMIYMDEPGDVPSIYVPILNKSNTPSGWFFVITDSNKQLLPVFKVLCLDIDDVKEIINRNIRYDTDSGDIVSLGKEDVVTQFIRVLIDLEIRSSKAQAENVDPDAEKRLKIRHRKALLALSDELLKLEKQVVLTKYAEAINVDPSEVLRYADSYDVYAVSYGESYSIYGEYNVGGPLRKIDGVWIYHALSGGTPNASGEDFSEGRELVNIETIQPGHWVWTYNRGKESTGRVASIARLEDAESPTVLITFFTSKGECIDARLPKRVVLTSVYAAKKRDRTAARQTGVNTEDSTPAAKKAMASAARNLLNTDRGPFVEQMGPGTRALLEKLLTAEEDYVSRHMMSIAWDKANSASAQRDMRAKRNYRTYDYASTMERLIICSLLGILKETSEEIDAESFLQQIGGLEQATAMIILLGKLNDDKKISDDAIAAVIREFWSLPMKWEGRKTNRNTVIISECYEWIKRHYPGRNPDDVFGMLVVDAIPIVENILMHSFSEVTIEPRYIDKHSVNMMRDVLSTVKIEHIQPYNPAPENAVQLQNSNESKTDLWFVLADASGKPISLLELLQLDVNTARELVDNNVRVNKLPGGKYGVVSTDLDAMEANILAKALTIELNYRLARESGVPLEENVLVRANQLKQLARNIGKLKGKNKTPAQPEDRHKGKSPLGLLNAIVTVNADVRGNFTVPDCLGYYNATINTLDHDPSAPNRKSALALIRDDLYRKQYSLLNIGIVEPVGIGSDGKTQVFKLTEKGLRILDHVHNRRPNINHLISSLQSKDPYTRSEGLIALGFIEGKLTSVQLRKCCERIPRLDLVSLFRNLQSKDPRTQAEAFFTYKCVSEELTGRQRKVSKDIILASKNKERILVKHASEKEKILRIYAKEKGEFPRRVVKAAAHYDVYRTEDRKHYYIYPARGDTGFCLTKQRGGWVLSEIGKEGKSVNKPQPPRRRKGGRFAVEKHKNPDAMWELIVRAHVMGENPRNIEGSFKVSDCRGWFEDVWPKTKTPTRGTVRADLNQLVKRGYLAKTMTGENVRTGQYRFTEEGLNRIAILRDMNIQPETFRMAMIAQDIFIRLIQKGFSYSKHSSNIHLTADFRQRVPANHPLYNVKLPDDHPLSKCIVEITYDISTGTNAGKLSFSRRSANDSDYGDHVSFSPKEADFFNGRPGSKSRHDTPKGSKLLKGVIFDDSYKFSAIVADGLAGKVNRRYFNNTSWFFIMSETVSKTPAFLEIISAQLSNATSEPRNSLSGSTSEPGPVNPPNVPEVVRKGTLLNIPEAMRQILISSERKSYTLKEIINEIRDGKMKAAENAESNTPGWHQKRVKYIRGKMADPSQMLYKNGKAAVNNSIYMLATEGAGRAEMKGECMTYLRTCMSALSDAVDKGRGTDDDRKKMKRSIYKICTIFLLDRLGITVADMNADVVEEIVDIVYDGGLSSEALRILEQAEGHMVVTGFDENLMNQGQFRRLLINLFEKEINIDRRNGFVFSERVAFGRSNEDGKYEPGLIRFLTKLASSSIKVAVVATTPEQRRIIHFLNKGKPKNRRIIYCDSADKVTQRMKASRYYYFGFNDDPEWRKPEVTQCPVTIAEVREIIKALSISCRVSEKLSTMEYAAKLYAEAA